MVFSLCNTIFRLNFSWLSETLALLLSSWGSNFSGCACCFRPATAELIVRQRGVATELTNAIPSAIAATESLESAMNSHLPPGDSLSTTLSSPQFSQALSMFWSALQSGQAGPVVRQFGLGTDAVNAAATGNIEEFVSALESEAKSGGGQGQQAPQQGQEDKKQSSSSSSTTGPDKKDDDDEGMALD